MDLQSWNSHAKSTPSLTEPCLSGSLVGHARCWSLIGKHKQRCISAVSLCNKSWDSTKILHLKRLPVGSRRTSQFGVLLRTTRPWFLSPFDAKAPVCRSPTLGPGLRWWGTTYSTRNSAKAQFWVRHQPTVREKERKEAPASPATLLKKILSSFSGFTS